MNRNLIIKWWQVLSNILLGGVMPEICYQVSKGGVRGISPQPLMDSRLQIVGMTFFTMSCKTRDFPKYGNHEKTKPM